MGTFYGNVLVARACGEVVPLLAGEDLRGYAVPVGAAHTVLYLDPETSCPDLAAPLSGLLRAPALGMFLYDSDVLVMRVCDDGQVLVDYDSCPGYFDDEPVPEEDDEDAEWETFVWPEPVGVEPDAFLRLAAGPVDRQRLLSALRGLPLDPEDDEDGRYVFAEAQHADVMACLGLDPARLAYGYDEVGKGELPRGVVPWDLVLVGEARWPAVQA
ncbi:hypothetical protein [Streptomyces griseosporeus]|uniref:hypothetical protein n=1 Tax=Streptomyces griseosporeus TaxID=1910 RepID=UPI0036F70A40